MENKSDGVKMKETWKGQATMEELGIKSIDEYFNLLTWDDDNEEKLTNLLGIKHPKSCYNCKYYYVHEFTGNRYSFNSACMILGENLPLNLEKLGNDELIVCDRWEE